MVGRPHWPTTVASVSHHLAGDSDAEASLTPHPCPDCREVALGFAAFCQCCCPDRDVHVLGHALCTADLTPPSCHALALAADRSPLSCPGSGVPPTSCPGRATAGELKLTRLSSCTNEGRSKALPFWQPITGSWPLEQQAGQRLQTQGSTTPCWSLTMAVPLTSRFWCMTSGPVGSNFLLQWP